MFNNKKIKLAVDISPKTKPNEIPGNTLEEKVAYIFDDFTIRQALEKMQVYRYNSIPILNRKGAYIGTLSEGDLLWFIKDRNLNFSKTETIAVSKVPRNKDNVSVSINTNIEDIIEDLSQALESTK